MSVVQLETRGREDGPHVTTADLREALRPYLRHSVPLALALVAADLAALIGLSVLIFMVEHWALKLALATMMGTQISRLFVIGHDAVHNGFTGNKAIDSVLGRIVFLPALHNYSLWRIAHNRSHHHATNVQGYNSWSPLALREFLAMPRWRQWIYRLYRTPLGLGPYYLVERWWKDKFFPTRRVVGKFRPAYWWDFALNVAFLAAWIGTLVLASGPTSVGAALGALLWGFAVPYAVWNYLVGFTVYFQHTNARVPWFRTAAAVHAETEQVDVTVHVKFPTWFEILSHHNMNHPAHHVLPKIPVYRLKAAQARLNEALGARAVVDKFSFRFFFRTMRQCKLYDYANHRWVDFRGRAVEVAVSPAPAFRPAAQAASAA